MKNNLINFLITFLLISMFVFIFVYSKNTKEAVLYAENIWLNNLIPSIFPSLIIVSLLIKYNIVNKINNLFKFVICKIYNIQEEGSFVVVLSMLTGFPTGSKYIKDLLDNGQISTDDANHLITFTSYSNPIFVVTFIGEILLSNKRIGIMIYFIHVISGLIIGLFYKKDKRTYKEKSTNKIVNCETFINNLINVIKESFNILLNMLGIIVFFFIIISIIDILLPNTLMTKIIEALLEITIGITNISKSNINLRLKAALIGMILSFNGLCVHFQTKSIIEGSGIKYKNYLIARVLHSILCFVLLYFFFYIFI